MPDLLLASGIPTSEAFARRRASPIANGASFHERLHRYIRIHTGRKHRVERSRERSLGEDRTRTEIIDERGGCKKPGSHGLSDAASGIRDAPPGLPPAGLSAPGIPADAPAGLSADATPGISPAGLSSATVRSRSFYFPSFRHFFALRVASARTSPLTSPSRSPSLRMMQPPPQQQQQGNWKDHLALPPRDERYRTEVRRARRARAVPADRPVAFLPGISLALPRNDPLARSRAAPRVRPDSSHTPRGYRS